VKSGIGRLSADGVDKGGREKVQVEVESALSCHWRVIDGLRVSHRDYSFS